MYRIALCNCPGSRGIVEERIGSFFGASGCLFFEFETIEALIAEDSFFDIIFIHKSLVDGLEVFIKHITKEGNSGGDKLSFVTYVEDDPVSDRGCSRAIEYIRQHMEYTSMYLSVEFLTDKGLRSIAVSKILFFEFQNRKIRIKTHSGEYFCTDTLRNVMALVAGHGFCQPHKAFIVNLKHVVSIKNYAVTMSDGSVVPLSQKKSSGFRRVYKEYSVKAHFQDI